ncbi:hypothetical protein OHC33_010856 [Knufia fluminis]|uniref:Uncharacterized protein n=1 Tax=Knufia fluminis TaxID=191047 RepID=A0AAN8E8K8_9EURO|nr:hypothetical protein OHC33_010856 [Knufia fluminis]
MLSSYFKAAKSRIPHTIPNLPRPDQSSKMEANPDINASTAAPVADMVHQTAADGEMDTPTAPNQASNMTVETEGTSATLPSIMDTQGAAEGLFIAPVGPEIAEETVVSPQASFLLEAANQSAHQATPMETDTVDGEVMSDALVDNTGDEDIGDALLQHPEETSRASEDVGTALLESVNESSHTPSLAAETYTSDAEQPTADQSMVSSDDMVLSAVPSGADDAEGIVPVNGHSEHNNSLYRYRPSADIPEFRGRSKSASVQCGDHYTYMANWPPQDPPKCDLGLRTDVFPPKDAPIHVWIQAYALRWGVWSAEVKDDAKRAQLLDVVGEKMKAAWETAIIEGHYVRPRETIVDMTYTRADGDGQDSQDKRGRKRAQSPTRLPAGFAHEGKDPFAITNGELAHHQITMDMIKARVEARDYEDAELLLDDVLGNLPDGRERLVERDWSATYHPSVRGRNLLMYSLWVVQDARSNVFKLNNLMKHFAKEQQKKNTISRIEIYQEREAQHLALATELQRRQATEQDAADEDNMETDPVDLTSDTDSNEAGSGEDSLSQTRQVTEALILSLAREVITANNEQALLDCFTTRNLRGEDFAAGGSFTVDINDKFQAASATLGNIYSGIEHVLRFRRAMKGRQPSEMIKMGHDARLIKDQIDKARGRLRQILKDDLQLTVVGTLETEGTPSGSDENEPVRDSEVYQDAQEFSNEVSNDQSQSTPGVNGPPGHNLYPQDAAANNTAGTLHGLGINTNASAQAQAPHANSMMPPATTGSSLATSTPPQPPPMTASASPTPAQSSAPLSGSSTSSSQMQTDLKQSYIDELWVPFLKKALADQGLPPISEPITIWPQIKDIMTQLGFSAEERNEQLRRFKSGYDTYVESKGIARPTNGPSQSPTPSVVAPSPALSHASLRSNAPPSYPTDAEILAAIPPQGIHGRHLMQVFDKRVSQHAPQFYQTVQRLALIHPQTHMVYQKQQVPSVSRQYNTLPPPPARGPTPQSQDVSHTTQMLPPAQARPGIVKLRYPPQHSSPSLPHQDESQMPPELQTTTVEGSRGFSFRHLPHATLEQRKRMDEAVGDYITKTCKARKKNPFGQYITFRDPNEPNGPIILHGFWDNQDGTRPAGSEWFFDGEEVPANWDMERGVLVGAGDGAGEDAYSSMAVGQARPKIKLNVGGQRQEEMGTGRQNAQGASSLDYYANYGVAPGSQQMSAAMQRGRGRGQTATAYQPSYGMGSIDPAQLSVPHVQSDLGGYGQGQVYAQGQGQGQATGAKKGTKRGGSGSRGGAKKKRRKNVQFEDQDDSGDYDPSRDF